MPNFLYRISNNQCGFIYLLLKRVYWAKFEAKLFSDAKRLGLLLQSSPLKFSRPTRTIKLFVNCHMITSDFKNDKTDPCERSLPSLYEQAQNYRNGDKKAYCKSF